MHTTYAKLYSILGDVIYQFHASFIHPVAALRHEDIFPYYAS